MNILVVDDDPVISEAIRMLAKKLDLQSESCDGLASLMSVYDHNPERFAFIILDLNLVDAGAEEILQFLEKQEHVPLILLISSSDLLALDQIAKSGLTKSLPIHSIREKPLNFRLLKELLSDVKAKRLKLPL